jgi:hypothetical protein
MAGSSWPGYALPGDAVYCPALVVANNGLLPAMGPIEVYRWRQPSLEVGSNKRRPVSPRLFLYTISPLFFLMFALIETNQATHIAIHIPHDGADKSLPALAAMLEQNAVFIRSNYSETIKVEPDMTIHLKDTVEFSGREIQVAIVVPASRQTLSDDFVLATSEAYISNKKTLEQRDEKISKLTSEVAFLKASLERLQATLDESKEEVA